MPCRPLRGLILFIALPLVAAEFHAEPSIALRYVFSGKWDLVVQSRARVVAKDNHWYDVAVYPTVRYQAHPRVRVLGGSYVGWVHFLEADHWRVYRLFGGVEPTVYDGEKVQLISRTVYERFLIEGPLPDFNRYRQRFRLRWVNSWSPYISAEVFFRDKGVTKSRYGVGVRRAFVRKTSIDIAYWYEARKFSGAGIRHMLSLTWNVNFHEH